MKLIRIIVWTLFALSAALLGASTLYRYLSEDRTYPQITCPEGVLSASVQDGEAGLLSGVSAWDEKDGDLTGDIIVEVSQKGGGKAEVIYMVADSDNHVTSRTRQLEYTDYTGIHFSLSKPLRYSVDSTIRILDRLTAEDSIDGDLSDFVRVTVNGVYTDTEGVYPVTFQVANSIGDTALLSLEITIKDYAAGEPVITLSDYLVYLQEGETLKPGDYLESVTNAELRDVTWELPEGGLQTGVNKVTYTCTSERGVTGTETLFVVVE